MSPISLRIYKVDLTDTLTKLLFVCLLCKLKCYVKLMKDPLGVSPSKGNQGTTRGKAKNSFDLGGNRTHDLRIRSTVTTSGTYRPRPSLSDLVAQSAE